MNKHVKPNPNATETPSDLERNPGIGASKGSFGRRQDPDDIAGENTFEGDVGNDTTPQGGVDPRHIGRKNK
jgi:hypothetical protein